MPGVSKKYNRICIIDSRRSFTFEQNILDFFDISHSHIWRFSPGEFYRFVSNTDNLTIFPSVVTRSTISTFVPDYEWNAVLRCEVLNGIPLRPEEDTLYTEDVVIHSTSGGGDSATWFLKSFPPKPILINELRKRYAILGKEYLGVHIRNTDYTSDVSDFLSENDILLREAPIIFLATDDPSTVTTMKTIYGDKVVTFSTLRNSSPGKPQHYLMRKTPIICNRRIL
jgi:hypothetical protein